MPYSVFETVVVPWLMQNERALARADFHMLMRAFKAFDAEGKGWIDAQLLKTTLAAKVRVAALAPTMLSWVLLCKARLINVRGQTLARSCQRYHSIALACRATHYRRTRPSSSWRRAQTARAASGIRTTPWSCNDWQTSGRRCSCKQGPCCVLSWCVADTQVEAKHRCTEGGARSGSSLGLTRMR